MSERDRRPRSTASVVRRVIVGLIIASFGLAALGGIVVLLGGELGTLGGRVLSTTVVVGLFSAAVLCCAALVGRRLQLFGLAGAAVSIATAGVALAVVWSEWDWSSDLWRVLWSGVALTVAFSFASLLLLLADRTQAAVRIGLIVTLILFAVVLVLVIVNVWAPWDAFDRDVYLRVLGVGSILAALGAIVVPVLSVLLRERPAEQGLSPATLARLDRAAADRGVSVDALVDRLLVALPPPYEPTQGGSPQSAPAPPSATP